jgi:hypothetical protein
MSLNSQGISHLGFPAVHFFITEKLMESFLSFFSKELAPRKPNSIPPLKPIHFEKRSFSLPPQKIACKRTVNYRYRTLIYELWVIEC